MKSFPWKCLNFQSSVLQSFIFVFLEQPGHWHIAPDCASISVTGLPCWVGGQRMQEKDKVQDWLLSNPQTDFRLLLIILLMKKSFFKIPPPARVWWNHNFSIPTIFKYRKWKKSRLTWTKLNDGIDYGLLVYIYHFFIWTSLEIRFVNCHSHII